MSAEEHQLMVLVTDSDGTEAEPMHVVVQGTAFRIECAGLCMVGMVDELRGVLGNDIARRAP